MWTTVRTVRASATGALATTLRDYHSGSWRYVYAGDAASGSAASAPIAVTVRQSGPIRTSGGGAGTTGCPLRPF